jgi:hypothetical protein
MAGRLEAVLILRRPAIAGRLEGCDPGNGRDAWPWFETRDLRPCSSP